MAPPDPPADLKGLEDLASSTHDLIGQYLISLSITDSSTKLPADPPNPLHVLRDSAKLLKAQTTKLSLLLINKPFTPSALVKVIREISGTCLPAMMSAVEICTPDIWGSLLRQEVQTRVKAVLLEMQTCMREVSAVAHGQSSNGSGKHEGGQTSRENNRDTLASTGVVWEACDSVIELEHIGIGGLVVRKAEGYRDMIKDAIEELQEWGEEGDEEEDEFVNSDTDGDDGDKDSIEDIFCAANKLPKDRQDLRKLLEAALSKAKKVGMLYAAIIKRRLRVFTPAVAGSKAKVQTLDELLGRLKQLPELIDDLASAFYDLDSEEVSKIITRCIEEARIAIKLVNLSWDGKEDEFTVWSGKWIDAVK